MEKKRGRPPTPVEALKFDASVYGGFEEEVDDTDYEERMAAYWNERVKEENEERELEAQAADEDLRRLAFDNVKEVFRDEVLRKLADGLYFSHLPQAMWRDPRILAKALLSMYTYTGYPSVGELIDNMDRRGLNIKQWVSKSSVKRWETVEAPGKPRTSSELSRHFQATDAYFRRTYTIMPKNSMPDEMRNLANERGDWLKEVLDNDTIRRGRGVNIALEKLNEFLDEFPEDACVLVPWTQYLCKYLCTLSYETNLELLKLTTEFIRNNCASNEMLKRMPMSSKFRITYFSGTKFGNDRTYWRSHHDHIWNTMTDCVCYSLIGEEDPCGLVKDWAQKLLAADEVSLEAKTAFMSMLPNVSLTCYTRPQTSAPPRTQIFGVFPVQRFKDVTRFALSYYESHKGSFSDKKTMADKIRKLLIIPVKSVCVPAAAEDLLLCANLYSNRKMW